MKKILLFLLVGLCLFIPCCKKKIEKKEEVIHYGSVMLYSTLQDDKLSVIKKAFEEEYPGVTLDYYTNNVEKLFNKLDKEYTYDQINADVLILGNQLIMEQMKSKGYLAQYVSPELSNYNKNLINEEGYYSPMSIMTVGIGYHKKEGAQKTDIPHSWEDVLKSEYNNTFVMIDPNRATNFKFWVGAMMQNKNYGEKYFKDLQSCSVEIENSAQDVIDKLVNDEYKFGLTFDDNCLEFANEEMQIDFVYPESDAVIMTHPVALVNNCLNPENGKLLINFLLSKKCQEILSNNGFVSCRNDVKCVFDKKKILNKMYKIDLNDLQENLDTYCEKFNKIFKG